MMKTKKGQVVELLNGKLGTVKSMGVNSVWVEVDGEEHAISPDLLRAPKTVKSYDGRTNVIIKGHQESLRVYPMPLRSVLSDTGEAFITGATYVTHKCGCRVVGNGTLQFPVKISFCDKHNH